MKIMKMSFGRCAPVPKMSQQLVDQHFHDKWTVAVLLDANSMLRHNTAVAHMHNNRNSPPLLRNLFMSYIVEMSAFPLEAFERAHDSREILHDREIEPELSVGDFSILIASKIREYSEMDDIDEVMYRLARMHAHVILKEKQVLRSKRSRDDFRWELVWLLAVSSFLRYKYNLLRLLTTSSFPENIDKVNMRR